MMKTWQEILSAIVKNKKTDLFPLSVFTVSESKTAKWPEELPCSNTILEFYKLCNGGYINHFNWISIEEIYSQNLTWHEETKGYYPNGRDAFGKEHLVLAFDPTGAPLVWNSISDLMATFWFEGGDWEPLNKTIEQYLQYLFIDYQPETPNDLWYEALQQISTENRASTHRP